MVSYHYYRPQKLTTVWCYLPYQPAGIVPFNSLLE